MITIKTMASLRQGAILWDWGKGEVPGFGARRQKGDTVAYVLKYRTAASRQRWYTARQASNRTRARLRQ
jgi:hypothetical protein